MAILQINPDDSHRADFQNGHFFPNFNMADHPRRLLVESYGTFRDQQDKAEDTRGERFLRNTINYNLLSSLGQEPIRK
jgi:hypothetical protein